MIPIPVEVPIKQRVAYRGLATLRIEGATRDELEDLVEIVCKKITPTITKE